MFQTLVMAILTPLVLAQTLNLIIFYYIWKRQKLLMKRHSPFKKKIPTTVCDKGECDVGS